jgi:adenylate cyclase
MRLAGTQTQPADAPTVTAPAADQLPILQGNQAQPTDAPVADEPPTLPSAQEALVVYADLRGLARAGERLAPEILVDEVLDVFAQTLAETARNHGGTVEQRSGDGLLVFFGHSAAHSDDALRAIQAAFAIRQAAARLRAAWRARLGIDLGVAIGISYGRIVGWLSADDRHSYTAIGDAVTLANRLQALARPGEILAAAEVVDTLNGASAQFQVEALPPLPVGGRHSPQRIYRIDSPSGVRSQAGQLAMRD